MYNYDSTIDFEINIVYIPDFHRINSALLCKFARFIMKRIENLNYSCANIIFL